MKVIAVDDETCQECADFLSLVERHAEEAKQRPAKPHQYSQAAEEAGKRLGWMPFELSERS